MSEPIIKQDDKDPKRIELLRGKLGMITFKARAVVGSKTVRRSRADFAEWDAIVDGGYAETVDITLEDAERYIDEAIAIAKRQDAALERVTQEVDHDCLRCRRTLTYHGPLSFITGTPSVLVPLDAFTADTVTLHAYICTSCGSTALFADGYLNHPLSGAAKKSTS